MLIKQLTLATERKEMREEGYKGLHTMTHELWYNGVFLLLLLFQIQHIRNTTIIVTNIIKLHVSMATTKSLRE